MKKQELKGIGGWLLLYVLIGSLMVIYHLYAIILGIKAILLRSELHATARNLFLKYKDPTFLSSIDYSSYFNLIVFSIIPALILVIIGFLGIYLIIKKSKLAIEYVKFFLWCNLAVWGISFIFMVFFVATDTNYLFSSDAIFIWIVLFFNISLMAWIQYFKQSIRIKNTLVN